MRPWHFIGKFQTKKSLPLLFSMFPVNLGLPSILPLPPPPTLADQLLLTFKTQLGFLLSLGHLPQFLPLINIHTYSYLNKALITLFSIVT